jgi:hypothetical protein
LRINLLFLAVSVSLFSSSCNQKLKTYLLSPAFDDSKLITVADLPDNYISPCRKPLNYAPLEEYPDYFDKRTVRVNFHFPDDSTRMNNFAKGEGDIYFSNMINNCNYRFDINKPMNLPEKNNTPNLNPQFQLKITPSTKYESEKGFYYYTDNKDAFFINKGKNRNNYSRTIIKKHAIDDDTILNIFIMPHHPDSLESKTYKTFGSGIALSSSIKIGGIYQLGGEDWAYATLLNHEVGHVFGLSHSWSTDGCDDTPKHPNCFYSSGVPPCDGVTSNNLMDYNNSQMAITPCQLGKMHLKISDTTAFQRKLVIPTWCNLDTTRDIVIYDSVEWKGYRDVSRNIIIEDGGSLTLHCRLSMPKGSSITVRPGGQLNLINVTLHNDCDDQWKGIFIQSNGKKGGHINKTGKVTILDVESTIIKT